MVRNIQHHELCHAIADEVQVGGNGGKTLAGPAAVEEDDIQEAHERQRLIDEAAALVRIEETGTYAVKVAIGVLQRG